MGKWSPSSLGLRCDFGPAGGSRPRGGGRPQPASHRVRGAQTSSSRYRRAVPPAGAEFRAYGCGSTRRRVGAGGHRSTYGDSWLARRRLRRDRTSRQRHKNWCSASISPLIGRTRARAILRRVPPTSGARMDASPRLGMTTGRTPTRTLEAPPIGQAPVRQDHVA